MTGVVFFLLLFTNGSDSFKESLQSLHEDTADTLIAATDCSFIPKSGRPTYPGGGKIYSSGTGKAEKGLEISTLAVVNVTENTAYHLSTRQTIDRPESDQSRVGSYLHHLQQDRASLPSQVRYLVADGYYSKARYIQGVVALSCAMTPICAGCTGENRNPGGASV